MAKKSSKSDFKVPLIDLLEAGVHFGHQARRWNPKMEKFIYTQRDKVHVFDLAITSQKLEEACEYLKDLASKGKKVCFVGTKRQAKDIVREEAKRCQMPYVCERWLGGTLTNWKQISKSIKKLIDMRKKMEAGEYEKYTKKENVLLRREINRLERFVGGLTELEETPQALFVVDSVRESTAVSEANQSKVKVVAMVDSNADPTEIDYPIPANDDAVRSIKLIVSKVADAVEQGRQVYEKKSAKKQKKAKSSSKTEKKGKNPSK